MSIMIRSAYKRQYEPISLYETGIIDDREMNLR